MKLSALAVLPFLVAPTIASYLKASYYSDEASCSGNILAEAFVPMGKCIEVPGISLYSTRITFSRSCKYYSYECDSFASRIELNDPCKVF